MKRPWDVRYHYCMCWHAGLMPVDGIYFCILLSSQNSEVSIYIVPNTCRWCEASMGCQLSVPHVWSRWFDARGLHIFCILISSQNYEVSIYIAPNTYSWHEASMMCSVPALHVWSRWFDASFLHIFLYTNFKSKFLSVYIYSPKYV